MSNVFSNLSLNSNKIVNLATPTADTDAATKLYSEVSPMQYFSGENTVFGSTDFHVDLASRIAVPLAGSTTIVGDFTATTNGFQTDFDGAVLLSYNIHFETTTGDTAERRQIKTRLERTRSAVTTLISPECTTAYIRFASLCNFGSNTFRQIFNVENGDTYEIMAWKFDTAATSTNALLSSANTSTLTAIRIG